MLRGLIDRLAHFFDPPALPIAREAEKQCRVVCEKAYSYSMEHERLLDALQEPRRRVPNVVPRLRTHP